MSVRNVAMLASASSLALVLGLSAPPAQAFDSVNWSWDNSTVESITHNTTIDPGTFAPTGMTQVEQLQVNIGNITASTDQSFTSVILPTDGDYDALSQLPSIQGAATAVANLISVDGNAATYFHDGQVAFGSFSVVDDGYGGTGNSANLSTIYETLGSVATGNQMTNALSAATLAGLLGAIKPGEVTATATADTVTNALVKLDAVAVSNVHAVAVNAPMPKVDDVVKTDNIVIGDLTQFNLNNVTATASAPNLYIGGVKDMGKLTAPVSNLTATAIGNLSTVTNKFTASH